MKYQIQQRIRTLAQLWKPFEYKGFRFEHWHFNYRDGATGDAWVAVKTVEAEDAVRALGAFQEQLIPIVDRIAFVSQCFAVVETEPFAIVREKDAGGVFYFRHTREVQPVHLAFDQDSIESLIALETFTERGDVFRMLREAANASTFYTRFAMLTSALEAVAGQLTVGTRIATDKAVIKDLLGDERLFHDLFGYGTGIRNQLLHGAKLSLYWGRDYVGLMYRALVRFFNRECKAKINETTVEPMRHFFGNYEAAGMWLKMRGGQLMPSLQDLVNDFDKDKYLWEPISPPEKY